MLTENEGTCNDAFHAIEDELPLLRMSMEAVEEELMVSVLSNGSVVYRFFSSNVTSTQGYVTSRLGCAR